MKDAYYFSHDSNARNDQRLMKLRMKYGPEGYGIYFMIIEILRDTEDYTLHISDVESICFDVRSENEKVLDVIKNFNLFVIEGDYFHSKSLSNRMERLDKIKEKRRESGKKGAIATKSKRHLPKNETAIAEQVKDSKAKNSKSIKTLESIDKIHLSELQDKNLDVDVEKQFDLFKDYLDANGKTYKDYRAGFRSWLKSPFCEKTTLIREERNKKIEMKARVIEKKELEDNSASPEEIKAEIDKALGKISRKYTV